MGGEGVIRQFNLGDEQSGFFLNYKNSPTDTVTLKVRFSFTGANSVKYNTVTYSTAQADLPLIKQLNGDTTAGADALFLKGMGTTKVKVLIPQLKQYSDSFPISVNRSELIFNIDESFPNLGLSVYEPPPKLSLLPLDAKGEETQSKDQKDATDLVRYDGNYDKTNRRYVFNIARHVQAIMNGEINNYGFNLVVADPEGLNTLARDIYINRVILAGTNKINKPKFSLSYIKLKNR